MRMCPDVSETRHISPLGGAHAEDTPTRPSGEEMRIKSYAVPAIGGVAVFGAVTAFAATLTVNSKSLGSGNATVSSCNASASVSYSSVYAASLPGYKVTTTP